MTRIFIAGDTIAHELDDLLSPNQPNSALCGRTPSWPDLWHGTGSQDEEERAHDLRLCAQCESALIERNGGVITR